jgi:5-formyltetrahydrofolate cyclo-ligase
MSESSRDIVALKKAVRSEVRARLAGLDGPLIQSKSRALSERLFSTSWWSTADWVFIYIPMFGEVETRYIVVRAYKDSKQVAIPRMEGGDLAFYHYEGRTEELLPHQFGILEPDPSWSYVDPNVLQAQHLLVLTPGLAFDRQRRRLGRGKGYYDRFLAAVRAARQHGIESLAVGLAFAEQIVAEVPVADHDEPLDGIATDSEIIE